MYSFERASDRLIIDSWLPDETLFSLASRHHVVSCNCLCSDTCRQLFGHGHLDSCHDLPSHIDVFVERTNRRFGRADEVILGHTLVPFYLPLNSRAQAVVAMRAMRGDRIGSLRYSLGILLDHVRTHHPLRACELCMMDDIERFTIAYWHCAHQVPGVWRCPIHHCALMVSSAEGTRTGHYKWCLPEQAGLVRLTLRPSNFEDEGGESQEQFARAALELRALAPNVFFESEQLARVYSDRLTALGLREISGKPRLTDCIPSILKSAAPLRVLEELTALPGTEDGARAYVSRLCWRPPVRMHPFLHLFTIVWLFGNWESFWNIVKIKSEEHQILDSHHSELPCCDHDAMYRRALCELWQQESRRA